MSKRSTPWATRRIYAFIKAHRKEYDIKTMCDALGITRSGYYAWLHNPISNRAEEDARLLRLIRASFKASHGIYGSPRVFLDLREAGETCSKHRVARLMRVNKIRALHGYRTRHYSVGKAAVPDPARRSPRSWRRTSSSTGRSRDFWSLGRWLISATGAGSRYRPAMRRNARLPQRYANTCRGRSMVKTQPDPGTSRTRTIPLFASTLRRQIASPSPSPDLSLPLCSKGRNIWSALPGGRPPQ
jgi:hypothetical protein